MTDCNVCSTSRPLRADTVQNNGFSVLAVLIVMFAGVARCPAAILTPGYHVFSILATDDHGNVRTADPKMVVVRRPNT